jgi:hypothetical protein
MRYLKLVIALCIPIIGWGYVFIYLLHKHPRRVAIGTGVVLFPWLYAAFGRLSVVRGTARRFHLFRAVAGLVVFTVAGSIILALGVLNAQIDTPTSTSYLLQFVLVGAFGHLAVLLSLATGVISYSLVDILASILLVGGVGLTMVRLRPEEAPPTPASESSSESGDPLDDERFFMPVSRTFESEGDPILHGSGLRRTGNRTRSVFGSLVSDGGTSSNQPADVPAGTHVPFKRNYSTLVLGASGFGKTEAIRILVNQMQATEDEPVVVFDYKSEYQTMFTDAETVVLSPETSTHYWNVFAEAETEDEFRDVAERIFPDTEAEQIGENRVFFNGARQLFTASLKLLVREDEFTAPDNADLREFLQKASWRQLHEALQEHSDLAGTAGTHLDPEAPKMALSHYDFLMQRIEDVFVGDFAVSGTFSIREYMQNPAGRVLILDMPQTASGAAEPAFRFFLDRAMEYALNDPTRQTYFLLDEFARVPHLEEIENLTGAGRSQKAQGILGLQGISQLKSNYDEDYAYDILASITQEILLRPGDKESLAYILDRLGKEQYVVRDEAPASFFEALTSADIAWTAGEAYQERVEESHRLSEAEVQQFDKGEAVLMNEAGWVQAQLPMWERLPAHQREILSSVGTQQRATDPAS